MKVSKVTDVEKQKILDVAEELFVQKGYERTNVSEIMKEADIEEGMFCDYFSSKEEVLDAIILRIIGICVEKAEVILENQEISVQEKFNQIILTGPSEDDNKKKIMNELQKPSNTILHQKCIVQSILYLTPLLTKVVEQGMEEGLFSTRYPKENMEALLVAGQFLFDPNIFSWTKDERNQKTKAYIYMIEKMLEAEEGTFSRLGELLLTD